MLNYLKISIEHVFDFVDLLISLKYPGRDKGSSTF